MSKIVEAIIEGIIEREGGFVNHRNDRGGATKYGITQETLSEWRGESVSVEDVKQLTKTEAAGIYRHRYVDDPGFGNIEYTPLLELVVDCGVHHGTHRATQWLQRAIGATPDGIFGPKTKAALQADNPDDVFLRVIAIRVRFFGRIVNEDHSQAAFIEGWLNRVTEFLFRYADDTME